MGLCFDHNGIIYRSPLDTVFNIISYKQMDKKTLIFNKSDQIFHQENIKECLNIRLYHLQYKYIPDDYERNENRLKILQTKERIDFINYRLSVLYNEFIQVYLNEDN